MGNCLVRSITLSPYSGQVGSSFFVVAAMARSMLPVVVSTFALAQAYVAPQSAITHEVPVQANSRNVQRLRAVGESTKKAAQEASWNPMIFGMFLGLFVSAVVGQAP